MFEGFERFDVDTGDAVIHGVVAEVGPGDGRLPLLLLHGFPQSSAMWHRIAPALHAAGRTVVATDLRGYGRSSRPAGGEDHSGYSFRSMAADQVEVMSRLGYDRFVVVSHDRGARVAHRMALDHGDRLDRLVIMDILPTAYVYERVDRRVATAYYHWFFFIQPFDLPERLIGADPIWYLHRLLGGWGSSGLEGHDPEALAEYERAFADPDARHAMMEDYRAGAGIDLKHDAMSEAAGDRIQCPTLILWGANGVVGRNPEDPLAVWRSHAFAPGEMEGAAIEGAGHFLAEDRPDETLAAITGFLAEEAGPDIRDVTDIREV